MSRQRNVGYTSWNNDRTKNSEKVFCSFDTETDGLGGKLLCISWARPKMDQVQFQQEDIESGVIVNSSKNKMIEQFIKIVESTSFKTKTGKQKKIIWLAHNMQYDLRQLLPYFIDDKKYKMIVNMRNSTNIFRIEVQNKENRKTFVFQDSFALFPMSLKKFTSSFAPDFEKLEVVDFSKERFDPKNKLHLEYAEMDALGLLHAFTRFTKQIEETFKCQVNSTISSTAVKAFEQTLNLFEIYYYSQNDKKEDFIRQSYRGGLVFLTTSAKQENCITYDINSSYPASMKLGVPYGGYRFLKKRKKNLPGFIKVRIKTPENLVVPILATTINGVTYWPSGEFETVITTIELDFALEKGYTLLEDMGGLYFEKLHYPFNAFVNKCEKLRQKYKGQPVELIIKLIQNSVYGKFGSNRHLCELLIKPDKCEQGGAIPLDEDENFFIRKFVDEDLACLPQFASWISANSRLNLLKTIYNVGPEKCYYGDTDSITMERGEHEQFVDSGDIYGQFKPEKIWTHFRPIAPKVYAGQKESGEWSGACKGVAKKMIKEEDWKDLFETKQIEKSFITLSSLRVALVKKTTDIEAILTSRKSTNIANSNSFVEFDGTKIRPKRIEEI